MFCPECKAEYRPGFARCSDCDVDLVSTLPDETAPQNESLRVIWEGDSESDCVDACQQLKEAAIHFKVSQVPKYRSTKMTVVWSYAIGIPPSYYEKAQNVLGIDRVNQDDENQTDDADFELPAADDSTASERVTSDSYLRKWDPENATVEVWSQDDADTSTVVELSLNGNLIHFRSELQQDGTRKFFVLPEDVPRAREILRQIREGTPPG